MSESKQIIKGFLKAQEELKNNKGIGNKVYFEQPILGFEDFCIIGAIHYGKKGNQEYFVDATFNKKTLKFLLKIGFKDLIPSDDKFATFLKWINLIENQLKSKSNLIEKQGFIKQQTKPVLIEKDINDLFVDFGINHIFNEDGDITLKSYGDVMRFQSFTTDLNEDGENIFNSKGHWNIELEIPTGKEILKQNISLMLTKDKSGDTFYVMNNSLNNVLKPNYLDYYSNETKKDFDRKIIYSVRDIIFSFFENHYGINIKSTKSYDEFKLSGEQYAQLLKYWDDKEAFISVELEGKKEDIKVYDIISYVERNNEENYTILMSFLFDLEFHNIYNVIQLLKLFFKIGN